MHGNSDSTYFYNPERGHVVGLYGTYYIFWLSEEFKTWNCHELIPFGDCANKPYLFQ